MLNKIIMIIAIACFFLLPACTTCEKFVDYTGYKVDMSGLQTKIGNEADASVGSITIDPKFREASKKLQELDLLQYRICEQLKNMPDSPEKQKLQQDYIKHLMEMHKITLEHIPDLNKKQEESDDQTKKEDSDDTKIVEDIDPPPPPGHIVNIEACKPSYKNVNLSCNGPWGQGVMYGRAGAHHLARWNFELKVGGKYEVWIEYAAGTEKRPCDLRILPNYTMTVTKNLTGCWETKCQKPEKQGTLDLPAGKHVLELERNGPPPHIRAFSLKPVSQ